MITAERQSLLNAELSAAQSKGAVLQALIHARTAFGFNHFTIMAMPALSDVFLAPHVLESSIPTEFVRIFDRDQLLSNCPILPMLRHSMLPKCWNLDDTEATEALFSASLVAVMRRFKLVMGAMFPVTSVDGTRFILRYDGTRSPLSQLEINELGMSSLAIFDVYDKIRRRENAAPNSLSARELEVVRWTAQGKTSIEIGQILTLSDHTVNAYLTHAIKKLDCVNRTQLVAKALRLKLIS